MALACAIPFVAVRAQSRPDSTKAPAADSTAPTKAPAVLERVQVRASRRRVPSLQSGHSERTTRSERPAFQLLNPLGVGSVNALLNVSPDFTATFGGGFSLLGGPPSANQVTLGGVRMPSGLVIGSGAAPAQITTSPWDVSVGGAAGATVNVEPERGSRFRSTYANAIIGATGTTGGGATAPDGPTLPLQVTVSGGGERKRLAYAANLFASRADVNLARWDRALPSITARVLDSLGTITRTSIAPSAEQNQQVSVIARLDLLQPADGSGRPRTREDFVTVMLSRDERDSGMRGQFASTSAAARAMNDVGALQFVSRQIVASRLRLAHTLTGSVTTDGVRRRSDGPSILVTDSAFGAVLRTGAAPPMAQQRSTAVEARTQATWFSAANNRRYLAQLQLRYDGAAVGAVEPHTTFSVASPTALQRGEALTMVRSAPAFAARARTFVAAPAASVGFDLGPRGTLLLGMRADAWRAVGVLDARTLSGIALQPRLGFRRTIGDRGSDRGPWATLRGGAGHFADWPTPTGWAPAWSSVGAGGTTCSGSAVARIDLTASAAECIGTSDIVGTTRLVAANTLRPVTSTRADLSLSIDALTRRVRAEVGMAVARYDNVAVFLPPYVGAEVRSRLAGDGDRALLVDPSRIAANGLVPPATLPAMASTTLTSAGQSDGFQYRVRLATRDPWATTQLEANYAWNTGTQRGIVVAPADGAPGVIRAPASGNRHTFSAVMGTWIGLAQLRASLIVRSGVRFTPIADRDLNGDGHVNDAAFVPAILAESWATQIPANLRGCVRANSGRIFAPNGCEGPWSVSSFVFIGLPGRAAGLPPGIEMSVVLSNPTSLLAGLPAMRGVSLGASPYIDPRLAQVTGFDQRSQQFQSQVLTGFGQPVGLTRTVTDPAGIALNFRIQLGRSSLTKRMRYVMDTLSKDPSSGARDAAAKRVLTLPNVPELFLTQIRVAGLTAAQKVTLDSLRKEWDSVTPRAIAGITPRSTDDAQARTALLDARRAAQEHLLGMVTTVRNLLTPAQLARLEPDEAQVLNLRIYRFAERTSFQF